MTVSNKAKMGMWVSIIVLVIGLPVTGVSYVIHELALHERSEIRRGQEDLDRQVAAIRSGAKRDIYLYDTRQSDDLLKQLEGMVDIDELTLDLTDVSEVGYAAIVKLPQLQKLSVYAGRGTTDRALARLTRLRSLETLELRNTRVTKRGLDLLRDLPNLRSLTIFCEPRLGTLDDSGLDHLKPLTNLRTLEIQGGWASQAAAERLKAALTNCKLSYRGD